MIQEIKFREPTPLSDVANFFEFIRTFFAWWYGDIPISLLAMLRRTLIVVNDQTSFSLILASYFKPLKNDYNIAGWLVGIVVKTAYLPIVLALLLFIVIVFLAILILQLTLMPVIIGLIILNPFLKP